MSDDEALDKIYSLPAFVTFSRTEPPTAEQRENMARMQQAAKDRSMLEGKRGPKRTNSAV